MNRKLLSIVVLALIALGAAGATAAGARPAGPASAAGPGGPVLELAPSSSRQGSTQVTATNLLNTSPTTPLGSGFTYQGRLTQSGSPANGQYDLVFTLFDAATAGVRVGTPITLTNQTVASGLFTVSLSFTSAAFQGSGRWLEIAVRQTGGGTYTTLSPRQALAAAPYALSLMPGAVITGTGSIILSAINSGGGTGLYGNSDISYGVWGSSGAAAGVYGTSTNGYGLYGSSTNATTAGVYGTSSNGVGVQGTSDNWYGVEGFSAGYAGVRGFSSYGYGVQATSDNFVGVYGGNNSGVSYAGWFEGRVRITGICCYSPVGTYQIDDPRDPANKYINQAAVESPELKNVYDGNVTTDQDGTAVVALPGYVATINHDFRYQLTVMGQFAQAIVSSKIKGNSFTIKTDKPNVEVSWQVTGVRNDPYAQQHPLTAEQDKPADEKGYYLHPELYGQPSSKSFDPLVRNPQPTPSASQPIGPGGK